jgi:hypothetical protein
MDVVGLVPGGQGATKGYRLPCCNGFFLSPGDDVNRFDLEFIATGFLVVVHFPDPLMIR